MGNDDDGKLVIGASVGDSLIGSFCGCLVGTGTILVGDEVIIALGDCVGNDDEGNLVIGASVGASLVGFFCGCLVGLVVAVTCGLRVGNNVGPTPGAATGD